jgi:hypothetical protein
LATERIYVRSKGTDYSVPNMEPVIHSIITVLNFFDTIAIGVEQGLYDGNIVRDQLHENIEHATDTFVTQDYARFWKASDLRALVDLRNNWRHKPRPVR